jgi:predicted DNA-binding antitoxin AbrB/MazE fold protein
MVHNIDAIYDHGVFRPVEPVALPEGARVHLRVEQQNGSTIDQTNYEAWIDSLAGRWQGEFVRGSEGDFEPREPMP